MLEGKAYSELHADASEQELEACVLLTNSHGKELLAPGRAAEQADNKKIILRVAESQVLACNCCLLSCHVHRPAMQA